MAVVGTIIADIGLGLELLNALKAAVTAVEGIVSSAHSTGGLTAEHRTAIAAAVAPVTQHAQELAPAVDPTWGETHAPEGG